MVLHVMFTRIFVLVKLNHNSHGVKIGPQKTVVGFKIKV